MYQRSLLDPDGHVWEPFWMDPTKNPMPFNDKRMIFGGVAPLVTLAA